MATAAGWDVPTVRRLCLNGVDAAWLPDEDKRRMRAQFERELERLEQALAVR